MGNCCCRSRTEKVYGCNDCDDNRLCDSFEQWNSCSYFLYFTIFELSLVLSKERFQIDAC